MRHSGQAIIVIHDDQLGLLPDQDERVAQRVALYERKGVAFTVRGEGGRNVSFPKGPNVNVGMGFFVELLGRGDATTLRTASEDDARATSAALTTLRGALYQPERITFAAVTPLPLAEGVARVTTAERA